jgi:preprotein translocase subunit SecG
MNSAVKLIIGIIIFLVGLYWYTAAPIFGHGGIEKAFGISTVKAFLTVFAGLFGIVLIFLGLIVAWIEYEDLKWEAREKKESKKKK